MDIKKTFYRLIALLIALIITGVTFAEENQSSDQLKTPTKGLSFTVFGQSSSSSIAPDLGFWYLRWKDQLSGWRIGANLNSSIYSVDNESKVDYQDVDRDDTFEKNKNNFRSFGVELTAQVLRRFSIANNVSANCGIGPILGWKYINNKIEIPHSYPYTSSGTYKVIDHKMEIRGGIYSSIGVQWHFHPKMALASEYGISLTYNRLQEDEKVYQEDSISKEEETGNSFDASTSVTRLALIYYF